MHKSGDVLLLQDDWTACLSFEDGRLIGAAVEREEGAAALEFVGAALCEADFQFWEGPPVLNANLADVGEPLRGLPSGRAAWATDLPALEDVPRLTGVAMDPTEQGQELQLTRATVLVVHDVDGMRSVRRLAARHGLVRTVRALAELRVLNLVDITPASCEKRRGTRPSFRPRRRLGPRFLLATHWCAGHSAAPATRQRPCGDSSRHAAGYSSSSGRRCW